MNRYLCKKFSWIHENLTVCSKGYLPQFLVSYKSNRLPQILCTGQKLITY